MNSIAGAGIGSGLGGGMSGWGNPGDAASKYLNKIPGTITPYYQPYINAGNEAMGTLMPQYHQLINDPTFVMNQIGRSFQASPGYEYNVDQATKGANSAAAAGGYAGSPAEQASLAKQIMGMSDQDYWNYVNTGLGQYRMGMQGMGGINQMGYDASTGLASDLASSLMTQANLAYAAQVAQNQANAQKGSGLGGLFGGLTGGFSKALTGGLF